MLVINVFLIFILIPEKVKYDSLLKEKLKEELPDEADVDLLALRDQVFCFVVSVEAFADA